MRRPDNSHRERRPSCIAGGGNAYADPRARGPEMTSALADWTLMTEHGLLALAEELSEDTLAEVECTARGYGFRAVVADMVDGSGGVNGRLVLAEPVARSAEDTLGLIVIPPGCQPGDGILFTRPRT